MLKLLRWLSDRANKIIASRYGRDLPIVSVVEYPRSGGTWIAELIGDALELPFPKHNVFPLGCAGILHAHWSEADAVDNVVYVVRDGRDVAISQYYRAASALMGDDDSSAKYHRRHYPRLADQEGNLRNCERYLKMFMEDWFNNPAAVNVNWSKHVLQWLAADPITVVKYEKFREDAVSALSRVVREIAGTHVEEKILEAAVYKYSFQRQTGREVGEEVETAAKRKGIVGDWRNYFDRALGEKFQERCGDALLELNYESEASWYENL